MKLTKQQAKAHAEAVAILTKERLTEEEKYFVLDHWHPGAQHINSIDSAYFTPSGLARDLAINVGRGPVIDLCAGIGALAHAVYQKFIFERPPRIVCVELNEDYLAVGRKVLPEATWIHADVFNLPSLGDFGCAIANPPFGAARRSASAPRYGGRAFEFHVLDIASDIADEAAFLIPQVSAPFRYSGSSRGYSDSPAHRSDEYVRFSDSTGIELEIGCSIDTSVHKDDWRDVNIAVELVIADLAAARQRRGIQKTRDLFTELHLPSA